MPTLRLFAGIAEVAGVRSWQLPEGSGTRAVAEAPGMCATGQVAEQSGVAETAGEQVTPVQVTPVTVPATGGTTVAEVIAQAEQEFGSEFADQVQICRIWLNGKPAQLSDRVADDDEVALLPPVSGG